MFTLGLFISSLRYSPWGFPMNAPNVRSGFSTVAGGNSNDYLSRVNDSELWEASVYISLVNVPSWGIVLAQPGRVHTTCAE